MNNKYTWIKFYLLLAFIIVGCSTSEPNKLDSVNKPTLEQLVNNKASITKSLKSLDKNLSVQILKTGTQGQNYVRIISLKLSGTPVIAAVSETNQKNAMFRDILANADVTPIGVKLFSPNSQIKRRDDMDISEVKISEIKNPVISEYLYSIGYTDNDVIIMRDSQFYYQKQTMDWQIGS